MRKYHHNLLFFFYFSCFIYFYCFRAAYICQSEDKTLWQKHLLQIGFEENGTKNVHYMANALNCFMMVSDVHTIEELTAMTFHEFRYVYDIEE